jgi:hypothetical protein
VTDRGEYLFVDLDVDGSERTVVVAGDDRYLPERTPVVLADLDPLAPVVEPTLLPSPAYPFPAWMTLVRGQVAAPSGDPVADAGVTLSGGTVPGRTDARGEFVVPLPDVGLTDVIDQDGSRILAPDGDPLVATASHPTHGTASEPVSVAEGEQAVVDLSFPGADG